MGCPLEQQKLMREASGLTPGFQMLPREPKDHPHQTHPATSPPHRRYYNRAVLAPTPDPGAPLNTVGPDRQYTPGPYIAVGLLPLLAPSIACDTVVPRKSGAPDRAYAPPDKPVD